MHSLLQGVSCLISSSHGRDSRLRVWSLDGIGDSNAGFSTKLPIENTTVERKQPWLIHALPVSTLNFCSFAGLEDSSSRPRAADEAAYAIAVPGTKDSDIEIYQLPTEKQMGLIPAPAQSSGRAGMVMALGLLRHGEKNTLLVACGYENGLVCLYKHVTQVGGWEMTYSARPHSQPVLSLDVSLSKEAFYTSSADAVIAKHPLHKGSSAMKELATGHSGQQGLRIRNDDKIFATAGWDSRIRVYSSHSLKEVAVLKWHKEGCYAIAFASMNNVFETNAETNMAKMREDRVRNTHWLAAGSKDGKVSLWDIY